MYITATGALSLAKGETWNGPVVGLWQDAAGTQAIDTTGWTAHGTLALKSTPSVAAVDLTTTNGLLVLSGNYLYPNVSAATTNGLAVGAYQFDCFVVDASGTRSELCSYEVFITSSVVAYP